MALTPTLIETIAAYLKTRDENLMTGEADDAERTQSATDIASVLLNVGRLREALADIRVAIVEADRDVLTDTLWMPDKIIMGATVVDYIDLTLLSDGVPVSTPKGGYSADINNTGDGWIQVTISGDGANDLTEEHIEAALDGLL